MPRTGRLACASFVAGVIVGCSLACAAFLLLRHHGGSVLRDLRAALPVWASVLLGSSLLASLATAYLSVRAARQSRNESLCDSAFAAFEDFVTTARQYLNDVEGLLAGQVATAPLARSHGVAHARLIRLPGSAGRQAGLLDELYRCLVGLAQDTAGLAGDDGEHIEQAKEKLRDLEISMSDLGGRRRPYMRRLALGGKNV